MPRTAARRSRDLVPNATSPDALTLFTDTSARLRRLVPFDAAIWRATDPLTGLITAPVLVENLTEGGCTAYWECELLGENVNLFRDLTSAPVPVAGLRESTGDRRSQGALYQKFMRPRGFDDELRAVFRVSGRPWGLVSLFRERGRPPFDPQDIGLVTALSELLARRLRGYAQPPSAPVSTPGGGPGLLLFDAAGTLVSVNDDARRLLAEMPPGPAVQTPFGVALPAWVLNTAAHARLGGDSVTARVRVRSRTGRWLICHGSCLRDQDGRSSSTAIVIEPATGSEMAALVTVAYELSPRELEVTQLIASGLSTREIAARLHLSPHTVRDYVKAVFDKVEVTSRGELVAKLFTEHCAPLLADRTVRRLTG
ncbi:helix-turn-helix transcriptional regulator [Goodfellowiella coeruleoviolacea]|uniref:Regulatory protein, luxR family n=1 Tax=Goodfellowiella coeruleoviolacea TaxID=334858 RepID=A0AAE3KIU9_9PSEU|nr:helix-turn-helix transcriptional regulator [Goodfellowiella coeruleoviolacea]MCP2168860.1 regulatory protein, luxR family [Goodfellowiella coeruleoviolacea]